MESEKEEQFLEPPGSSPEVAFPILEEEIPQHIISDPNSIVITQEDLYEAGFVVDNLESLTDEQLAVLIQISEQRMAKANAFPDENSVAIILTDDGGLKITDHSHQEFYFSPAQLDELKVNVNNLTEENVQSLVQMTLPSISLKDPSKNTPSTSYSTGDDSRLALIGETVQIRDAEGHVRVATVRYIRGHSELKIQFEDGEFGYATMDQLILPQVADAEGGEQVESYSPQPSASTSSSTVAQPKPQHLPATNSTTVTHRHLVSARKRALTVDQEEVDQQQVEEIDNPPVLKRSYHHHQQIVHHQPPPNFCCPICDKKVYQKEPSYIVIRLPACDGCTREKIIVLDS
ncbi:unnamed protein product [Caenorhabditis angaria]|uniref:Uncharacterized protein n=1 Tax=Caenorhabditis angaria TaxID=860376 RepID=A0A9P1MYX4_9PELO|nr:unnamed protein product [Caenorhabditis angaria]